MIAGMLLFHLEEEAAFWGLVAILEMIMPSGYYNTDLLAARADQIIFQVCTLVNKGCQVTLKTLKSLKTWKTAKIGKNLAKKHRNFEIFEVSTQNYT